MSTLQGQEGELRFTLQITRKDTGKVEQVELVGRLITDDTLKDDHGSDPLDGGPQCSD